MIHVETVTVSRVTRLDVVTVSCCISSVSSLTLTLTLTLTLRRDYVERTSRSVLLLSIRSVPILVTSVESLTVFGLTRAAVRTSVGIGSGNERLTGLRSSLSRSSCVVVVVRHGDIVRAEDRALTFECVEIALWERVDFSSVSRKLKSGSERELAFIFM